MSSGYFTLSLLNQQEADSNHKQKNKPEEGFQLRKLWTPRVAIIIGGLVGYNSGGTINMSYWDKQTTGCDISSGSDLSFGKTTVQMKQQATFVDWNFLRTWRINENSSYPLLRQRPNTEFLPAINFLLLGG